MTIHIFQLKATLVCPLEMTSVSLDMSHLPAPGVSNLVRLLTLAIVLKYLHHLYYQSKYWPSGPRGLPILGNIFQLQSRSWFLFNEWKAQYGVFYFSRRMPISTCF